MVQIGDWIDFNLPGSDLKNHTVNDYKGKVLVLYTYPRDHTPGCTVEANGFKVLYDEFKALNAIILGLNHNSLKSHQSFITRHCLPFPLLIDESLELIEKLGAKKDDNKVFRKTYIIDENGILEKIYDQINTKTHPEEVLDDLKKRRTHR